MVVLVVEVVTQGSERESAILAASWESSTPLFSVDHKRGHFLNREKPSGGILGRTWACHSLHGRVSILTAVSLVFFYNLRCADSE